MQQLYIIAQTTRFRGEHLAPLRVAGKQYVFKWDKGFDGYAIPMKGMDEANELLLILFRKHSFLFIPGIAFRDVAEIPLTVQSAPVVEPSTVSSSTDKPSTDNAVSTPEPLVFEKRKAGRPRKMEHVGTA